MVELATINFALLGSQPKLCEDPRSISLFLIELCCFWLVHFVFFVFFFFGSSICFNVFVLVFFSFRFNKNARAEKRKELSEIWRKKLKRGMRHRRIWERSIFEMNFVSDDTRILSFEKATCSLRKY